MIKAVKLKVAATCKLASRDAMALDRGFAWHSYRNLGGIIFPVRDRTSHSKLNA